MNFFLDLTPPPPPRISNGPPLICKPGIVTAKEGIEGNRHDLNQDHNKEVINEIGAQIEAERQEGNFDREIDL